LRWIVAEIAHLQLHSQSISPPPILIRHPHPHSSIQFKLFTTRHESLAVVLLDLQMPGSMDGWAAATAMRAYEAAAAGPMEQSHQPRRIVIVACTACELDQPVPGRRLACGGVNAAGAVAAAGRSVRDFTLSCGVDAVVSKPIATSELRRVVEKLLLERQ